MLTISPFTRALSRTRLVSRLKNKPTRVNERETTKRLRRFSSSTISPSCKIHLPPAVPLPTKGGERSLPLGSHAAFPQFLPSSLLLHRLLGCILIAWTPPLETRPFPRVERVLPCAPLGSPLPPPVRPPGVEIYSPSCPTLSIAAHGVM